MEIIVHHQIPEDAQLRDQWNSLVHRMERPEVFYTYEWALSVSHAYAGKQHPLLISAHEGGDLKGVVALTTDAVGKKLSFLAGSTADYCDFVSAVDDRQEFIECVMSELRRQSVREICLANLPADSHSRKALLAPARSAGYSTFRRLGYRCARVSLASPGDRMQTQTSTRSRLKRMEKVWARHGEITIGHHGHWDKLAGEFQEFTVAHIERFLASGKTSNLIFSERRAFLLELGRLLARQGWFMLSALKLNERTVAWNYGFRFEGSWFWYQPTFDADMAHLSPGSYLLSEVIRRACEDPDIHTVDLGLGDETYKERFSNSERVTLHVIAANPCRKAMEVCRFHSAELVKRSPRLERRVRAWAGKAVKIQQVVANNGVANTILLCVRSAAGTLTGSREISFFECSTPRLPTTTLNLLPLSYGLLARAAMEYEKDVHTIEYALRSAERLSSGKLQGYALTTETGMPVHFCWASSFEGFRLSELRQVLKEPAPDSVLIFDCWTPSSQRGNGYYGHCIAEVASLMLAQGKRPWIFSAANDTSSLRGIEKSGFVPRFSLNMRKRFFLTTISSSRLKETPRSQFDLYPAA